MSYNTLTPGGLYVNVQRSGIGAIGKTLAASGLVTNYGTVSNGVITPDGQQILMTNGLRIYGEQAYVTEAVAITAGFPSGVNDVQFGGHSSGNFLYGLN